jgi:GT2 family glycosyltransferase
MAALVPERSATTSAAEGSPYGFTAADVAIAIPTYGRDEVLIDTLRSCLEQSEPAGELIVLDQTPQHTPDAERILAEWHADGTIRWERLKRASQPAAMNRALEITSKPLVLFLDDDIIAAPGFVAAHAAAHIREDLWIVVGQIIQPWQQPSDVVPPPSSPGALKADLDFPFHSTRPQALQNVMSGHMSVRTDRAREIGGFDENFYGAAYRFDTEFGRRATRCGGLIQFEPRASIRHLRAERGGTRIQGNHLASASPTHGVGDYYFALLHGCRADVAWYCSRRMVREVCTKFHLKHPWYIPVKLIGEIRAFAWACQLIRRGPALLGTDRR